MPESAEDLLSGQDRDGFAASCMKRVRDDVVFADRFRSLSEVICPNAADYTADLRNGIYAAIVMTMELEDRRRFLEQVRG